VSVSNCCISQGSVTTYLRCDGNYYTRFVGNFFLYSSAKIFEIDKHLTKLSPKFGTTVFFGTQCIYQSALFFTFLKLKCLSHTLLLILDFLVFYFD